MDNINDLPTLENWESVEQNPEPVQYIQASLAKSQITIDWNTTCQIRVMAEQALGTQNTLIIHIHGGGFISMSSSSHQNYSRLWAHMMPNAVVCSLDYRLAPNEGRFPDQLDDCWQAYYYLVKHSEKVLKFKPERIILVGDSAGGNLVLSLCVMAIERKFRIPDGVVPCYACSVVSLEEYWPSLMFSLDDLILTQSFLNLCVESYLP